MRWARARSDARGYVRVDGRLYCAGPAWHDRWLLVGARAWSVEVLADRGRHVATLERAFGDGGPVRNPRSLIPALIARPRAFGGDLAGRVVEAGRACSLTVANLREWAERGTPRQVEYLAEFLEHERASREASKRARLLRACALPAPKTFDGYDWTAVSWPDGFGRDDLLSLSFLDGCEDLVLMGDVGTGKTHMASALCTSCCEARVEARFFTASSLVMRLRRARGEGTLDREMSRIGRARLLVVDELGFLPLDPDGARLLFQVVAAAYERQSVVFTTNVEFSRWGDVFGDDQMAAAVIDRIVHHGRLIRFHGESYRVRHALMQGGAQKRCPDGVTEVLKN